MSVAADKRAAFARLHARDGAFFLPNPWDVGSARILVARGAEAIATTSAGFAFTLGAGDGAQAADRALAIDHAVALDRAVRVPVSADLENGYADDPDGVAETVAAAVAAGLAGCSIEDVAPGGGAYAFDHAVARIQAAVAASREARSEGFQLTARADGMMTRAYDLAEAERRLKAFEAAGADVLYAPAPPDPDALARLCRAVAKPVNALAAGKFLELERRDFAALGARRISLGSSLARATHALVDRVARDLFEDGDPSRMRDGAASSEIDALLREGAIGAAGAEGDAPADARAEADARKDADEPRG